MTDTQPTVRRTRRSDAWHQLSQLRHYADNLGVDFVAVPALIALIGGALTAWADPRAVVPWALFTIGMWVFFFATARSHRGAADRPAAVMRWGRRMVIAHGMAMGSLAAMGILFWQPGNLANHIFIVAILAASVAPALGPASTFRPLVYTSVVPPGLVLTIMPLREGDTLHFCISLLAAIFFVHAFIIASRMLETTQSLLTLRDEKDRLIKRLKHEKQAAESERARAQSANESKSSFLANVSHELRTPLNAIIGFSDVMQTQTFGPLHETYLQYAGDINSSGQHLLSLIDDILDLARIEAGRFELSEETVDLEEIAEECSRLLEISAAKRSVKVCIELDGDLPPVLADRRSLRQIWLNLGANALKFTDKDGCVTLFAWLDGKGELTFGVRDTGCGMDAKELERVQGAFEQGQQRAHSGERGYGLGLAIVNALTEAHGARFSLSSKLGEGTTAMIHLPFARVLRPSNVEGDDDLGLASA